MPKLALAVEYVGTKFHGSQLQLKQRTVQSEIESALKVLFKKDIRVVFSGRTDAGVHASNQVAHIVVDEEFIDVTKLPWSLNGIMGKDVAVKEIQYVDDSFHARYSAESRTYVYKILNRPQRSPLLKETHYFIREPLNLKAMSRGASRLLGRHDFAAFRSSNADQSSTICNVSRCEILNLGEGQLEFWIVADHFVYNMVRIIVGTLVEIGLEKRTPASLSEALQLKRRDLTGPTAPPRGLTLNSVKYPAKFGLFRTNFEYVNGRSNP